MTKSQGKSPTWYQFFLDISPEIPNLLQGCNNQIEQMTVLSSLIKTHYGIEEWDSDMAGADLTWLFDLENDMESSND
jgi:hypothetical protein